MLVAINMGKLSAFIDDDEVQTEFSEIANCAKTLFDEDNLRHKETNRVRIVSFANHQIFELFPECKDSIYPVDSFFIKKVLCKITDDSCGNLFRTAFNNSKPIGVDFDPCYINYQLLSIPAIQDTIIKIIIFSKNPFIIFNYIIIYFKKVYILFQLQENCYEKS